MRVEPGTARAGAFVLLVIAIAIFTDVMLKEAAQGRGYDLVPIVTAGRLVATGNAAHLYAQDPHAYNLVDDPVFNEAARDTGFTGPPTPFVYPPLIARLMTAISDIPFSTITRAWAAISVALVLMGVFFTRAVYLPHSSLGACAAAIVALCAFEPILYGFWLSQTTELMFPMVMGTLLLERRGQRSAAGALLALATFIKITPGLFVLVWLWRGPWRAVISFAGTLVALWGASVLLMGVDVHVEYVRRVMAASGAMLVAFNNHSLLPFLSRFVFDETTWLDWRFRTPPTSVLVVHKLTVAAMVIGAVIVLRRLARRTPDAARMTAEGMAFLMILLVPGIAWTHYFVFLLPVMAIVLRLRARASYLPLAAVVVAFALCCRPLLPAQHMWPSVADGPLLIGLPTLATLLLFVTLLIVPQTSRRLVPAVAPANS